MCGQPVKITKKDAIRNDELEVFHVAVGMGRRRVVIEHQQDARHKKNDEKDEGDRAQIVRGSHAERLLSNLDWQPVEEKIAENGEAARAVRIRGAAAEDGLPDFGLAKILQSGMECCSHLCPQELELLRRALMKQIAVGRPGYFDSTEQAPSHPD